MGRIKGHYEWDDDDLAPGHKKEGGLHQNLFDSEGKLKGSARFVPDGSDTEPLIITETVYLPVEERRLSREEEELQQAIAALVGQLIDAGIAKGKPLAEQWWRETARPAIAAKRSALDERRSRRKERKRVTARGKEPVIQPSHEVDEAWTANRPSMSSAEAQARTLAALAARAYSDEQMRLLTSSNVVRGGGLAEPQQLLAELPPDQVSPEISLDCARGGCGVT